MTKLPVAAGLALALVAGSAAAADLPSRKGPPILPPPPPPMFSWTGLYGGVNIGYGFGDGAVSNGSWSYVTTGGAAVFPTGGVYGVSNNVNGVTGGGQIGYNYQFSPWLVLGFEADIQASDIRTNGSTIAGSPSVVPFGPHFGAVNSSHFVDWWGTARGRIGVTMPSWPNLMVYGTGGFAYGGVNRSVTLVDIYSFGGSVFGGGIYDNTSTGWTAGGGLEWTPMAFPAWSLKVEYLYTDLGTSNVQYLAASTVPFGGPAFVGQDTVRTRFHSVRAGLNWHFNPFAPSAPVLAKY